MSWWYDRPYASVAEKRAKAARERQRLEKKGQRLSPVVIEGRNIATTFWGKAWCDNVESYRDLAYRLERGRSYARNGAVIDLQIGRGEIRAKVSGTSLYTIAITIGAVPRRRWETLTRA